MLQASLEGLSSQGWIVATATDPNWRAVNPGAWRADAAPVHSWGLIGATELLDLRRLPPDWFMPAFPDSTWPAAIAITAPAVSYQPRSIPPLAMLSIGVLLRDAGRLSSGRTTIDLPPSSEPATLSLTARSSTAVSIESLALPDQPITETLLLDGARLRWQPRPGRLDVLVATQVLPQGEHRLTTAGPLAQNLPLTVSTAGIDLPALSPQQGNHAGRRLLLADPLSQPSAVTVTSGPTYDLTFHAAPTYAVLDLGRIVHGRVVAQVSGPTGSLVDIGWDERFWRDSWPLPFPGSLHPQWNQVDSWVLDGQKRSITTIDARAGRYILVAVWGAGPVQLSNLRVYEERYPAALRGSFASDDPQLDRVWQVGVETLRINMLDAYADPWRERGQWWGDAFVSDRTNRVALGDTALLARGLRLMAEALGQDGQPRALAPNGEGNYLLDYGMLWVQSLHDYARTTGDVRLVTQLYPAMVRLMVYLSRFESPSSGLLDIPPGHWTQTSYLDPRAYSDRFGQSTALNALYYGTMLDAANLAELVGDPVFSAGWRQHAAGLREQINRTLYQPRERRYLASIVQGAPVAPSPQAQAWALAYDVVPDKEQQEVADSLLALLSPDPANPNLDVFGLYWALEGLGKIGRINNGLTLIRRYYGYMLNNGATTWWETLTANRTYSASLSHGWGSGPTWFLTTYVLGARRTGARTWEVHPALRGVTQAAGTLPVGDGTLQVRWNSPSCTSSTIEIAAPAGVSGTAFVPIDGTVAAVTLNGVIAWRDGRPQRSGVAVQANGIELALGSGQYRIEITRVCATPALYALR
jgi:alpha-L-rhamnosidase